MKTARPASRQAVSKSRSQERQFPGRQTNTVPKTGSQGQLVSLELRRMEPVIVLNMPTPTMKISALKTLRRNELAAPFLRKFDSSNGPRLVIQNAALNPSEVATLELDK
jgi:hypothetical protein